MSGIRIRIARKPTCNNMDKTTVHGLLVFLFFTFETTISSNISELPPPGRSEARLAFGPPGFVAGCGSGACHCAMAAPSVPRNHERSSDTKTGIRSYHNPHDQGKGESPEHLAAHQEQDEHREEGQTAGQDGSRKRLIDGLVDDSREWLLPQKTVVFPDAVEDHDRVVHRITDQGQQRSDYRQRNLETKNLNRPRVISTSWNTARTAARPKMMRSTIRRKKPTAPLPAQPDELPICPP